MNKKDFIQQQIITEKILPLYYADSADESIEILKTLHKAGIKLIEYTNRGANALQNFKALRSVVNNETNDLYIGAGTIKTAGDAKAFIDAGADFIVGPVVNADVAAIVQNAGLLWIPGCMTATEIFTAETNGATIIKIFPGNILGPTYIKAIKEIFSNILFMPTGGVDVEEKNLQDWFNAGVCAVGMGSKLISKKDVENKDYNNISQLTKKALRIIASINN